MENKEDSVKYGLTKIEDNKEVLNIDEVNRFIITIENQLEFAKNTEEEMRKSILEAMIKTDTFTVKLKDYTISQIVPKDEVVFDTNKFLKEQSEDVASNFCSIEKTEQFNLEKFKNENPELFNKYNNVEEKIIVDVKRLQKSLPNVYEKYITVTPNKNGKIGLRIVKAKKKEE